ncbi:MAG: DUF4920 domain-containing protein [Flavobacteriales bacterium]|nr:DUF4920 domain-containing protein [Flavobacteriales bacterium]
MNNLFIALLTLGVFVSACGKKSEKTETTTSNVEYYGDTIQEEGAITTAALMDLMKDKDSAEVKITTTIREVCQKKGCWMDVELTANELMTVRFKDYGFFVPKDAAGKTAVLDGIIRKEIETVEWLRHKAEDAGKSKEEIEAITQPDTTFTFEARGVIIKPAKP